MQILEVLKALSDETRIRIIALLYRETLCICELEVILNLGQSNISRHVTKLKHAKLITHEKKAQWIYYRVDTNILKRYPFLAEIFNNHFPLIPQCQTDLISLNKYKESGAGCGSLANIDRNNK